MRSLLKEDGANGIEKRLIDIGTGNGVLALFGASIGFEVTAVDNNPRAIDFAEYNRTNNQSILHGCVSCHLADINEDFDILDYDIAFANPPFAPVESSVPHFALGGHLGQERFLDFVNVAGRFLKPSGRLYCVQLLQL